MNAKPLELTGWGRALRAQTRAWRPERAREALAALAAAGERGLIAYGRGRSYGDAPLNDGGDTLLTGRLDRMLAFDPETGILECEPGVSLREVLEVFLPRGWLFPVTPGTAFVSMGGALANDVHGKNHDRAGSFGEHVAWFDLALASGEVLRVSRDSDPELFAATVGGVGLTGLILRVALRMVRVPSASVRVKEQRIANLEAFMEAFAAERERATFSVGWIDALAKGPAMGRGILETGEFEDGAGFARSAPKAKRVPLDFPGFALNPLSVSAFNAVYWRHVPAQDRSRSLPAEKFFYPLDAILEWNRIYGKRGFYQFQCVIPDEAAARGVRRLLEEVSAARASSFLAVLKTLGGEGPGFLSFPLRGYTLALDLPRHAGVEELFARLEAITLDHGGRIYLAKDALLSRAGFQRMYPKLDRMRQVLARVDPAGRFQSDLSRRLGIRG